MLDDFGVGIFRPAHELVERRQRARDLNRIENFSVHAGKNGGPPRVSLA